MIITRGREHTVNMGNYESVKISASVSVDTSHFADQGLQETYDMLDQMLIDAMSKDVTEAKVLTNTKDSYILSWRVEE